MKERPILFSGPMVRAILEGRKTQTRRVITPQPDGFWGGMQHAFAGGVLQCVVTKDGTATDKYLSCPYGAPGDRLWVRETFFHEKAEYEYSVSTSVPYLKAQTYYAADVQGGVKGAGFTPGIFMPRNLSRITLEITDVRVQRLQDISEGDAEAEGAEPCDSGLECSECPWIGFEDTPGVKRTDGEDWGFPCPNCSELCAHHPMDEQYRFGFRHLWDSINAKRGFGWEANPWVWAITFRRVA